MRALPSPDQAEAVARELLEPLGRRWAHVRAVARRADELTAAVESAADQRLLVVAAWWHDLGYAPALRDTGCHQVDGARFLAAQGYPERLCSLVAHHSAAVCEADERGRLADLDEWAPEQSPVADALWTADMTTGPGGERVDYPDRLSEIQHRYDPDSVVGRAMRRAEPSVRAAVERTRERMRHA